MEVEAEQWPRAAPRASHSLPARCSLGAEPQHRAGDKRRGQKEEQKNLGFIFFFLFQTAEVVWGFYTAIGVWGRVGVMVSGCPQWKAAAPSITAQCHLPPLLLFLSSPLLLSSPVPSPFPLGFCHISHLGKGSNRRRSLPPPLPRRSPQEHWDQQHWGPSAQGLALHSAQEPPGGAVRATGDRSGAWSHPGPIAQPRGSVPPQEGAVGGFSVETATVGCTGEAVGKISHG